jgi:streptogramin lyase
VQRVLPNGERIRAYTAAPGGGLWIVRGAALVHLDPVSGDTAYVAAFADSVSDVVAVSGKAVGIVAGGSAIEILDTSTGLITRYDQLPGPVRRLAAAGGRRFIVEMDEGEGEFGRPGDLWLLEIP